MDDKKTANEIIENENAHRFMATPFTRERHTQTFTHAD